jgi:hypothetical protein
MHLTDTLIVPYPALVSLLGPWTCLVRGTCLKGKSAYPGQGKNEHGLFTSDSALQPCLCFATVSGGQSSWLQNGDVLCFLWGTNWIYICYAEESRPSLWSSGQSSWLEIQRSGFDSRLCQIMWEVVGLERGPLSLVSTTERLLERKSSGSGLENREYGRRDPSRWPGGTLLSAKVGTNFSDKRRSRTRSFFLPSLLSSRDSTVGTAPGCNQGLDSQQRQGFLLSGVQTGYCRRWGSVPGVKWQGDKLITHRRVLPTIKMTELYLHRGTTSRKVASSRGEWFCFQYTSSFQPH